MSGLRIGVAGLGFGGGMPPSYELVYHERVSAVGLNLALWVQRAVPHEPAERA